MRRTTRVGAALAALALIIAACGGDDDDDDAASPSETAAAGTSAGTASAGSEPASGGSGPAAGRPRAGRLGRQLGQHGQGHRAAVQGVGRGERRHLHACRSSTAAASSRTPLIAGNATGDVPDVFEGAHDRIGELVTNGVLAPVDLGVERGELPAEAAVDGVTWDGRTYGVPWAVENVALLTNKDARRRSARPRSTTPSPTPRS